MSSDIAKVRYAAMADNNALMPNETDWLKADD